MTCIAAISHNGDIWIGADSAGISDLDRTIRADPKVFIKDNIIMGFTSSFRMGQLLMYSLKVPPITPDLMKYMVVDFVDSVRSCLKEGGYNKTDAGRDEGGTFIVGLKGKLFKIYSDYQVEESVEPYTACGCGDKYALGSFYSTITNNDPEHRVGHALRTAAHFSSGVCAPYPVLKLPAGS